MRRKPIGNERWGVSPLQDASVQLGDDVHAVGHRAERQRCRDETTDGDVGATIRFCVVGIDPKNATVFDVSLTGDQKWIRFGDTRLRQKGALSR